MQRRGVLTVVMAMELVLVGVLLLLFGSFTEQATDRDKTQELLVAEDIVLLLDAMQSSPYDFTYEYDVPILDKAIAIEGNSITVDDVTATEELAQMTTARRYFSKARGITVPSQQELKGSLLRIYKNNNEFRFEDTGGSIATPQELIGTRAKGDLAINVYYIPTQHQGKNIILEHLQEETKAALAQQGFVLEPSTKANQHIIFSFTSEQKYGKQHRITHSLAREAELDHLSSRISEALHNRLSLPVVKSARNYNNRPSLGLDFLDSTASIAELGSDSTQSIIALTIAGYFEQTYNGAGR